MKTKAVIAVLGLAAAAFALPASAQVRSSAYAGFGLGQSKFKGACASADALGISGCDEKDTAFKLFGGYQFNPNIAAEGAFHDFGKATAPGESLKGWAVEGSAVGGLPLANQFSLLGRLGLYYGELKADGASKSKLGLTFGFGAQFDLNRNLGFRAEWQRFNDVGGGDVVKSDIDVLGISGLWRFQ
jgi:OOP family OmpA-OmpF porin